MKKEYNTLEIDILRLRLHDTTNVDIISDITQGEGADDGEYDPDAQ